MRKGGGKNKGSSFERQICVALSRWVSEGKQDDAFWRSAMSGGRSTVAFAKGKRLAAQAGDISSIHPVGAKLTETFVLECKFYASLDYTGLLTGKGNLAKFWDILRGEGKRYSKLPFLIAKQNRQPTTVCLSSDGARLLGARTNKALLISPPLNILIFDADKFFANNPYAVFLLGES